jgi:hypothetical protein
LSKQTNQHKPYYRYYNDTYDAVIYLYIGTADQAYDWLKKRFKFVGKNPVDTKYAGLSFTLTGDDNFMSHIIWMPNMNFTCDEYTTLSHECLHTAINIMEDRGCESMGKGASEELAYFHSAIYGSLLKQILHDRYPKEKEK